MRGPDVSHAEVSNVLADGAPVDVEEHDIVYCSAPESAATAGLERKA
jgi:hypothetical protein